jgi:hypothetical protein
MMHVFDGSVYQFMSWVTIICSMVATACLTKVCFVRLYLRAGRPCLKGAVCGVRIHSLIFNFVVTPNLNCRKSTALRQIRFPGETVSIVEDLANPWMVI